MYKKDFPIFTTHPSLVYLDSASSAQKPGAVIDGMKVFMESNYSNIHRGAYDLSMESSLLYDRAKEYVGRALGGVSLHEIVFTHNATYAFNLIARSLIKTGILKKGDHVLLSKLEHHANIVPWQIIREEYGIIIDWAEIEEDGTLDYEDIARKIPGTKVVSLTGASNVTGEILDIAKIRKMIDTASEGEKPLLIIDGSQRFPHMRTDVRKYGIDIFVATGHKAMSDTGIGFFYARKDLLRHMIPAFCGGSAINSVTTDGYEPAGLPFRHEPGTPHIIGAVSLLRSLEYIESTGGFEALEKYERELTQYALEQFQNLPPGVRLLGPKNPENRLGVFSFAFLGKHPNDVAEVLADNSVCVRSGHHCTEPLHHALGIGGSLRASLYLYNTKEDIERFTQVLKRAL